MTGYHKTIEDCTFAEIRDLVLDATDQTIPAFTGVLESVHGRVGLLIDIKQHSCIGRVEELLCHQLDQYPGKFAIASFDPRILGWFEINRPSYIRGQIAGGLKGTNLSVLQRVLVKNLLVTLISRPDFVAYEHRYLNRWIRFFTRMIRLPVLVWTIRDPQTAKKCRQTGQNYIFEGFG